MSFAEGTKSYADTRKRTSVDYVKFSPSYRVILRILDPKAKLIWKHWVKNSNNGRGMGAVCPNITAQTRVCPIDEEIASLPKEDKERRDRRAKKRYMVNVLDRTPNTVCPSCNTKTPGEVCENCKAPLPKKAEYFPLNKVKILEAGPQLFEDQLNSVEENNQQDFHVDITGYDIQFKTKGVLMERKIAALPLAPSELSEADFIDPETNEPQKLFDLELLGEPTPVEEIRLMMNGASMNDLNALRGIE